jgi:KIX domain
MNPQQFQNMGMGRGVPMQMNPAFNMNPQMSVQMGDQQIPMQGVPQQNNMGHPQIQRHIFTTLQNQGPFSGWQATVNVNERAAQVKLLVDSLRLVRPPVEPPRALDVALQFERKCFSQSTSRDEYYRECSEKLGKIRDQRAQQMNQAAANNMQNMQGMQGIQQNFPMQMNPTMGTMTPRGVAMGMPMMQQQQQQQRQQQQQQLMQMRQRQAEQSISIPFQDNPQAGNASMSMMSQQAAQQPNTQPMAPARANPTEPLSTEDNKMINQRAADLAKSVPKDKIRQLVNTMSPQVLATLQQRGIEPIIYYFRMMAAKEFRRQKAMQEAGNTGQVQNSAPPQQDQTMGGQTPFMNEMGRFQGLQAEGLRSQDSGEVVVPASNNPMVPVDVRISQQMIANSQRMGQQGQGQVNPGYLDQQRRLQQQQTQAARLPQPPSTMPSQTPIMGQGQMQTIQQPSTPLSALNRPVNLGTGQGPNSQPNSRPPSRTPQMNQGQTQPVEQQINMQQAQNRERILAQYPVQVQNILRQKPTSEWKAIIQALSVSNMQRSTSQQPQTVPRPRAAPIQGGAFLGGANIGTPMQPSLSAGATPHTFQQEIPPNQAQVTPEMLRQRQIAMQQQQARMQAEQSGQQSQVQVRPLNQQQLNFMDNQVIPGNIMNLIRNQLPLPNEVKTWINLKQWVMNGNQNQNITLQKLLQFQSQHFTWLMKTRQQQQAQQMQQLQQQQPQINPQQQGMPQQMPGNPGQAPGFRTQPQMQNPTDQDIQRLRAQNPRLQNMTDDQIRQAIIQRQRQHLQQSMGQQVVQRPDPQPTAMPPQQAQKAQTQPPSQTPKPTQPPTRTVAQPAQPKQAPSEKAVKWPTDPSTQGVPTTAVAPQLGKMPQLTKEQIQALPPDKRAQYLEVARDRQLMQKLTIIAKGVQQSLPALQPVNLTAAARQRLVAELTKDNTKAMLNRFDFFLMQVYKLRQDEAEAKILVSSKLHLFAQYVPASIRERTWIPAQTLTITPDRAEEILKDLLARFQAGPGAKQPTQGQLTQQNLTRLQEEEERKKSTAKGSKDVPPAPTTSQPPFQIGDARGQGTPKYGGPGLKAEDLKLDPKRRKKNPPAGQTPASQVSATPSSASPQIMKSQAVPTFRCAIPNCERNKQGFPSQAELDRHTNTVHKIDTEPITDPLAFLDASLRDAFNLDENFKQIRKPQLMAPPMEKTASKSSIGNTKSNLNMSDDWEHSKITLEELNNIFGDMDWEEAVPAAALELQDKFIEQYQRSEEWQKLIRTPLGSSETNASSSVSPPVATNGIKTKGKEKDSFVVDLEFDGLDLGDLSDLNGLEKGDVGDVEMSDGSSPFEVVDKPALTAEQQFLLDHGIDYTRPEAMDAGQKQLMEFIMEPIGMSKDSSDDVPWEEIDWDAEEKQKQEDIRLGTPGAWNGHGFNRFT